MSLVDQQKELEYYPDEVLAQEMMQPTGIAPSFLVATEIKRRNDMRNSYQAQMNPQPQMSVVEEEAMELGGIANADPNAMQQQMMAQQGGMPPQPMPQQQMPQNAPMQMAEGGTIQYEVEDGASVTVPDDEAGFLSAGLGAVGLLREGGNIRYQEGEDIDFDETGGFIRGPLGNKIVGEGGWLYDPSSAIDNILLAGSAIPIGGRAITGAGLLGKAGIKGAVKGAKALKGKIAEKTADPIKNLLEGIGSFSTKRLGFKPSYGDARTIPMTEVGKQATKAFTNPLPLSLSSPFWSKTAPIGAAATFIGTRGGEDSGIGTESDASIIEAVNAEEANAETISIDDMTIEELQALIAEREAAEAERMRKLTEKLEIEKETKRREALPDSARMLEDAMANVPENTTFQDYLSTLEGMEESRKGQVLMDLGASIANASHGGDIAKGFQEAGTKARAEKIEVAKERARVLGESRAMDINTALKMSEIDYQLKKSDQITLSGWLDLFADNPDLIQAVEDADDPIAEIIKILSRLGVNTDNMEAVIKETGTK